MDEFAFIRQQLAPLARGCPGARDLTDDAATLAPPPGCELVITTDALVAGVHFRAEDALDGVAKKALRVNLSDLAAKGAEPIGYLLAIAWPHDMALADMERFVAGLAADQARYGVGLLGGDTVVGPGPLTIAITALGAVPVGAFVPRAGARAGDKLFVTGTIGDAALGLRALQGGLSGLAESDHAALADRYRTPQPRTTAAVALREVAHAAIDVSDGLVADAGHVAHASCVRLVIEAEAVPLSAPAQAWLSGQPDRARALGALATGGDDYEILFAGAAGSGTRLADASSVPVTRIGRVEAGQGVQLVDASGQVIAVGRGGFTHF